MFRFLTRLAALCLLGLSIISVGSTAGTPVGPNDQSTGYKYPFQNPDLPIEDRVNNIISLMTLDEKIACLGTNPSVPRLGIKGSGHVEGLHGLAQGGPGK